MSVSNLCQHTDRSFAVFLSPCRQVLEWYHDRAMSTARYIPVRFNNRPITDIVLNQKKKKKTIVVPKYLKFSTVLKDFLTGCLLWLYPVFWRPDMNLYLREREHYAENTVLTTVVMVYMQYFHEFQIVLEWHAKVWVGSSDCNNKGYISSRVALHVIFLVITLIYCA